MLGFWAVTAVFVGVVFILLLVTGCGVTGEENVIPKSDLPAAKQEQIRQTLHKIDYSQARDFAQRYGKDSIPFIIERVMKVYDITWTPEAYLAFHNVQAIVRKMRQKILAIPMRTE